VKCPNCMGPIGPDDRTCPSCGAVLVLEKTPNRPEEENGWAVRHLASIMGRIGCAVMVAQNALVLVASAFLIPQAIAFLNGPSRTVDLTGIAALLFVANTIDLVGLGLISVALIVLGVGSIFLRRRDPFTEAEVMVPTSTAIFPMAAGLLVFLWVLLTAVWRIGDPAQAGSTAAEILANYAIRGPAGVPPVFGSMMTLWVVAAIVLVAGSGCLRMFVHRLPAKIVSGRPTRPSSWLYFAVVNLIVTIGIAAFPLGIVAYDTSGGPAQIAFLTFLATKLTFVPLLGAFAYWSLLTRFDVFGKLSLLVPVLKAIPRRASTAPGGAATMRGDPGMPTAWAPPPSDDDMVGIDRVK